MWNGHEIAVGDVMRNGRAPRSMCVVGDTFDASGASHIAENVDVLVHEATNVAAQTNLARTRGHSSTIGATAFAKKVNAKRLILNHVSVSYSERKIIGMEAEARSMFGVNKAFVARDLSLFSVPTEEEDTAEFGFRRFVGFTDCNRVGYTNHPFDDLQETGDLVDERLQEGIGEEEEDSENSNSAEEELDSSSTSKSSTSDEVCHERRPENMLGSNSGPMKKLSSLPTNGVQVAIVAAQSSKEGSRLLSKRPSEVFGP